jgi:hypothetical protein
VIVAKAWPSCSFQALQSHVYADDGLQIEGPSQVARVKSSPSWEEFEAAREEFAELERERLEIEEYESGVVRPIKERLHDENKP